MRRYALWIGIGLMVVASQGRADDGKPIPEWLKKLNTQLDSKRITLDFTDTPFADVMQFISQVTQVNVVLDPRAGLASKRVTLNAKDLKIREALTLMLRMHGASMAGRLGVLVVSTPARLARIPEDVMMGPADDAPPAQKQAWARFQRKVTLDFSGTPLPDVVQFMRETTGSNIVLDRRLAGQKADLRLEQQTVLSAMTLIATLAGGELKLDGRTWRVMYRPKPRRCVPCKKLLNPDWKFCPHCGLKATEAEPGK